MIKKSLLASLILCLSFATVFAQPKIIDPKVENATNPIGLDVTKPVFSWKLQSEKRNTTQSAYEIKVFRDGSGKDPLWTTGKVNSDQSLYIVYAGPALQSAQKYWWQVRVWDNSGRASDWSGKAFWQMGLLSTNDWKAKWISPAYVEDSLTRPSPLLRKTFQSSKKIQSATAFITALGLYEAFINGKRIGDSYLTPGWTNYARRIQYQQYDVTNLLAQGNNAIGVTLGSGWYRGFIGFSGQKNFYGKELALLFRLAITYTDGTTDIIVSDETWKSSTGDILSSEIYHGETIDHQKEKSGWNTASFNESGWSGVKIKNQGYEKLIATYNEPIRKHESFKPVEVFTTPAGEQVIDFGQNLVGWVQVKVTGKAGDKITLYHAEVLDKKGNFYTENLRPAKQQNIYILKGGSEESFEPHFTFQGFRYIKIEGYPGEIKPENFTAVALYSDMQLTGNFTSSNPLINQLQKNIQWGQRGNFLDVPTDCPQRDERLGWTGDAQAFARTASFNFDVKNFFSKWLKDLATEQREGSVPFVVPNVITWGRDFAGGSAGWADAATIIPWDMYLAYGDKRVLEDQYESMKAWVGYMQRISKDDLWNTGFHFGDWLFYRPFDDNDGRSAVTDKYLIAQCFYAHSTQLVINAAHVLGKKEDGEKYAALLKRVKDAFNREYVTSTGRLVSGTQTAYVLALNFDMLPEDQRKQAAERLVTNIKSYGNHLSTGFLGTPYLCHVLSRFGHDDVAFALLEQESYPSWLYPVKMGATTIWERWDGIKPDSTFQTPGMNSFNHYAYGAIGDWMYRVVAGIDTDPSAPGYKSIRIKPHLGGKLTNASAQYETRYGLVKSSWKVSNGKLTFDVEVPANTKAVVYIPTAKDKSITEGAKALSASKEITVRGVEENYTVVEVGSGKYQFSGDM
ncbi:MAG TPA: glycoside hydrolase family 78 protein [Chryseosolibacter sp.]